MVILVESIFSITVFSLTVIDRYCSAPEFPPMKEWIIIMTAANRAGILAAVTRAMHDLKGDLRESSQTVVRGFFTMIFSADFPETIGQEVIRDHLQDVCRPFSIDLAVRDPETHLPVYAAGVQDTRAFRLRVGGRNEPGFLQVLSQLMARLDIDITGMHAVRTAENGEFEMILKLALPSSVVPDHLLQEIETVGRNFGTTAELRPAS